MELNKIHKVYFIGIGGIGMSALARYFAEKGIAVYGYDKTPGKITDCLIGLGISITFTDDVREVSGEVREDKSTLVVYTPAIPGDNKILKYFESESYKILKRSEVLGLITKSTYCLAVAGTHGKTTTSALLGHVMNECGTGASAFIGGHVNQYDSNVIFGENNISVVEADEYDRSFMHLSPNIACITSMDADHLDVYGKAEELEHAFKDFTGLLADDGKLICRKGLDIDGALTYSIEEESDYLAKNVRVENGKFLFDLVNNRDEEFLNVVSNLPGRKNIENTLAAYAMAEQFGLDGEDIVKAIKSFEGIYRRFNVFDYRGKIIVDDYAHHPSEVESALETARELFLGKKIMVVFQPHLFSRTKDFMEEFADILSKFDSIRLLDIYPARELPIEGVSSKVLLEEINNINKKLISKDEIANEILSADQDVVMMLGAGDISIEIEKLKK
ncbi:MAG: UDP-N-acetylmuramate--L-alanine ligase [Bacteroidota bacterium]